MKFKKEIRISGMHCGGCVKRVEAALNALDGVKAKVDLKNGTASLVCTNEISDSVLKETIEALGFEMVL